MKLTLLLWLLTFGLAPALIGAINFEAITENQIDFKALHISKSDFFAFATAEVSQRKLRLGAYGIVDLELCDYPVKGRPLNQLKNLSGRPLRLLSTPSCEEQVLKIILLQNYQFSKNEPSPYKARRCVYTLLKVFRPMMEYYTLKYENPEKDTCPNCADQKRRRLAQISKINLKTKQFCGLNDPKVQGFLNDLSSHLDVIFRQKADGALKKAP